MAEGNGLPGKNTAESAMKVGNDGEEDEYDTKERVLQKYFLQEWNIVKSILDDILSTGRVSDLTSVHKIRSIFDKYQEQGQLLEPYLESLVSPLMLLVRSKAIELGTESNDILELLKPVSIVVYTLVTVCGYKSVINFFPHKVSDLELAVTLLEKCHDTHAATALRQESTGEMEANCVVLLWLSILVLVPFDISSVDTSIDGSSNTNNDEPPPLVLRILGLCKDFLTNAGPMRTISGLLLSRLLTRPDMSKAFISFTAWTHEVLPSASDNVIDHFRLLGVVEALAAIFKTGSRNSLLDIASSVWDDTAKLMKSGVAARSPLLRKYLIKLTQRVGFTCLPHRVPSWRYKGRITSLGHNGSLDSERDYECSKTKDMNLDDGDESMTCEQEEEMDVPEIIEEIIEVLLIGLKDTDTVVRWSAAKGLGRITSRLTSSLADEVLTSVLELFTSREGDGSWHGGCLAFAELARRGLLLPISFQKVVPVVIKALHYDIRKGPHSIGAHVRDAAAFVCWAFGRAYYHKDMRNVLEEFAPHLLTITCYDREVNCRRAAAAAFQENVGRQGDYPHGIDIVNTADYFALSSRVNSYLHVAVHIAQFEGYLLPFVDEILSSKICHWDKGLRELSSKALSALVKYDPGYFENYVLGRLIPCTLSTDLCMRHGATLAAAEVVLALHRCDYILCADSQKKVAGIVPAIEKARLYRGKGGEIMRSSVSRFIECISLSHISIADKTKKSLLDTINENLRHPNSQIQNAAVGALKHFLSAYYKPVNESDGNSITLKYVEQLTDPNVAVRRGSALALGALPHEFLVQRWKDVISKLCNCCLIEENADDRDAEARVNAVKGLVSVCETLTRSKDLSCQSNNHEHFVLLQAIKTKVMKSLFEALEDYSVDNRGDVGSWVREAAMNGLERCTYILCWKLPLKPQADENEAHDVSNNKLMKDDQINNLLDADFATELIGGLVKQATEKLDKIRESAAKVLERILHNKTIYVPFIPYREKLEEMIPEGMGLKWADPTFSYPRFVRLLQFSCYSRFVLSGLVIAIGGLQDSLRKASFAALLDFLHSTGNDSHGKDSHREQSLCADLVWVLQQYKRCDRVIISTLKTIELLFARKVFLNMEARTAEFCAIVLDSLRDELRGSKDFSKLYAGIAILGYIASVHEAINARAFGDLLTLLGHRYPKIRKACAEQVYLVLLQTGDVLAEEKTEKAIEIISETCWDGDVEEAKLQRLKLFELAGLDTEPLLKRTYAPSRRIDKNKQITSDENASYSALVSRF